MGNILVSKLSEENIIRFFDRRTGASIKELNDLFRLNFTNQVHQLISDGKLIMYRETIVSPNSLVSLKLHVLEQDIERNLIDFYEKQFVQPAIDKMFPKKDEETEKTKSHAHDSEKELARYMEQYIELSPDSYFPQEPMLRAIDKTIESVVYWIAFTEQMYKDCTDEEGTKESKEFYDNFTSVYNTMKSQYDTMLKNPRILDFM